MEDKFFSTIEFMEERVGPANPKDWRLWSETEMSELVSTTITYIYLLSYDECVFPTF